MMTDIFQFWYEFEDAMSNQLMEDEQRWGDTWLQRPKLGQEERVEKRFNDYFDQFYQAGVPVPWLKIIGNAYIAWIREQHPELFPDGMGDE
jgi:hypothetical protein